MSLSRSLSSVVGVVALALTLAGCSLLPGVPKATPTAAALPAVGQCWNATVKQADDWADWEGTASVKCTSSHTLYTYHVGSISDETGSSWASPSNPNSLSDEIQTKAEDACSISTLLPHLKWNQQLINGYFFVPSEALWKAGQRWVRCDVGVLATGTTLDNESFTALPSTISTLVSQVASDPVKFEFCMDSSTPVSESGPLDNPDATLADCKDSPQWRLTIHGNFPTLTARRSPTMPPRTRPHPSCACRPSVETTKSGSHTCRRSRRGRPATGRSTAGSA